MGAARSSSPCTRAGAAGSARLEDRHPLAGADVTAVVDSYAGGGWEPTSQLVYALREVEKPTTSPRSRRRLKRSTGRGLTRQQRRFRRRSGRRPTRATRTGLRRNRANGEVMVFVDGLRLDVAHVLADRLQEPELSRNGGTGFAALPTVTQTAKPALVPIARSCSAPGDALNARDSPSGATAGVQVLRSLMPVEAGVQVLGARRPATRAAGVDRDRRDRSQGPRLWASGSSTRSTRKCRVSPADPGPTRSWLVEVTSSLTTAGCCCQRGFRRTSLPVAATDGRRRAAARV